MQASTTERLRSTLVEGMAALDLPPCADQVDKLLNFLDLMTRWNRVYNLTAVRTPEQMVARHLLDSLALVPFVQGETVLDVGSGAGLPAIPVAIARPDVEVTALDSNGKKTRFITQAKSQLGLENVKVEHTRVEQFAPSHLYSTLTSRAFASLAEFDGLCRRLCRDDGEIVAMLGRVPQQAEIDAVGDRLIEIRQVAVPGVDGERHIARIRPVKPSRP